MGRKIGAAVENNFVQGLITDSTALNFPENAVTDSNDCIFDENGSVLPRLGFDFESDFTTKTIDRSSVVVTSFLWKAAAGSGDNQFVVLQVGSSLYLYRIGSGAISDNYHSSIDLTTFSPSGAGDPDEDECQFASGNGYLFVSHPFLETFYVEYDPSGDSFSSTQIDLKIRDFKGVDDGLDVDERPSSLSDEHEYNLLNQGWGTEFQYETSNSGPTRPVLDSWQSQREDEYPSNADVWYLHKKVPGDGEPPEYVDFSEADNTIRGNSPAPKGHFILDVYRQDRSSVSGVSGLSVTTSDSNRASTVVFFAGRVWYSGVKGQDYSTSVYFSQIIERKKQFGQCYQANDPSSEHVSDLLPSDGGVIRIPEAGTIIKLATVQNSVLVFASNGIWRITGSEGIGFRANDYSVEKISNVATISASSFVSIDGLPAWWNQEGIYIIEPAGGLELSVKRISEDRVDDFFENIPASSKPLARGGYNPITRVVQWLYRSTEASNTTEDYEFDMVLNLNVKTGAFYTWSPDTSNVDLNGIVVVEGSGVTLSSEEVTNTAGTTVTNTSAEAVTVTVENEVSRSAVFRYICSYPDTGSYEFTFAGTSDSGYLDWFSFDSTGVQFQADFISGYKLHGEGQRKFQSNYIWLYTNPEPSASQLFIQGRWGFATDGDTGRWGSKQKIVFDGGDYSYEFKKVKIRGHGIVLQYYVQQVAGQPFNLTGWSVLETVNELP